MADQAALDYLSRLAALGMSFVGFSTIVVTLRRTLGAELEPFDRLLVRYYIENGLLTTVGALLPALLNLFGMSMATMWRVTSVVAGTVAPVYLEVMFNRRNRILRGPFPGRRIRIVVTTVIFLALWLNAAGIFFPPNGAIYALALTWFLISAGVVFLQTLDPVLGGKSTSKPSN